MIGAHVSTAGGLIRSLERAVALKSPVIQVFVQSPRTWNHAIMADSEIAAYLETQSKTIISGKPIQVYNHASYLINLASPDSSLASKSTALLGLNLSLCERLNIVATVVHVGSVKDTSRKDGIIRVASNLNRCLETSQNALIYLENTAGAGGTLGRTFEELSLILNRIEQRSRIGFCLDTQHLFASGIDYGTFDSVALLTKEIANTIGDVQLLHLNDSKVKCASHVDRHENLGKGYIGSKPLKLLMGQKYFREKPMVLEVPGQSKTGPELSDLKQAKSMLKAGIKLWEEFSIQKFLRVNNSRLN